MPIDWQHALGGKDDPRNPLGKGLAADAETGVQEAPNVVDLQRLPAKSDPAAMPPVSFLPLGAGWPARSQAKVSADPDWLAGKTPGLPGDFDYSWFQTSPPEQRGTGKFRPGDSFSVKGMHPEKEIVTGKLPLQQPWARVERLTAEGIKAEPALLELDTVWLFPDQEKGVLVWHGEARAADDEASDISAVVAGFGSQPSEFVPLIEDEVPPPPPAAPPPAPQLLLPETVTEETMPAASAAPDAAAAEVSAAPSPAPAAAVETPARLSLKEREQKAVADFRQQMNDMFDEMQQDEYLSPEPEIIDMINVLAEEYNLPALDQATYKKLVSERIDSFRSLMDEIGDDDILQNMPAEMRFGELSEEEAKALISEKFAEMGLSAEQSAALAGKVLSEDNIVEYEELSDLLRDKLGDFLDELGISPEDLADPYNSGADQREEKFAKLRDFFLEKTGVDLETLLDDDEDDSLMPANAQEMADLIADPELRNLVAPLIAAATEEVDPEGVVSAISPTPERQALKDKMLAKMLSPEEFAEYKAEQARAAEQLAAMGYAVPTDVDGVSPQGLAIDSEKILEKLKQKQKTRLARPASPLAEKPAAETAGVEAEKRAAPDQTVGGDDSVALPELGDPVFAAKLRALQQTQPKLQALSLEQPAFWQELGKIDLSTLDDGEFAGKIGAILKNMKKL